MIDDDDTVASPATVDDSVDATAPASPTGTTVAAEGTVAAPDSQLRPGDAIGRYEIVKMLGQGGMGMVYLAYDPTLDRPVALKLLRPELRSAQARLLREGQSVARLAHPNVVRVYDVGANKDDLFIAMEYVDGATLRRWLREEKRSPRAILELFGAAGRGLVAAHEAGLVHRDFKPDNVLVGRDGRVVVTDFGLARLDADDVTAPGGAARALPLTMTLTRTGSLLGTPAYMSPEQLRGEVADARSDQWSFCVACWEALFGARPFTLPERASLDDVRVAVEGGITAPANVTTALAPVERALRRGLSVDPRDRFPDLASLLAALTPARSRDAIPIAVEGERIAHFRVIERLGQGGMGIVYRARDEKLSRDVALKVLPADVLARADRRERFFREARAAAAVVHPAIATVFEVGTDGDVPFIAMELVTGRTLRESLARGPVDVVPLIRTAIPIADALARAHKAGIVHRDLKPENVMLDAEGAPKILDFGVARIFETAPTSDSADTIASVVTSEGVVLGTPAYMSPEQARGRAVDGRSDLFAFGTMLFELLTGAPPFRGASTMDIATAIIRDDPPPPSKTSPKTPLELDRIVLKCLEKDPADRYQDAAELVVDLRRLLRQTESGIAITSATLPPARPRRRVLLAALGLGFVIAGGGTAFWLATRHSLEAPLAAAAPPRFVEHQLTATGALDVDSASLSPDGKTLALARNGRLILQDVSSGTTHDVPAPTNRVAWVGWFPDNRRLLVAEQSGPTQLDIVITPIDGGPKQTLPFRAWGAVISPDGTHVATFDEGGIRVRNLDGSGVRVLVGTREEAEFGWPSWSPDGRWIGYALRGKDLRPAIRAASVDGNSDVLLVDDPALASTSGLPSYHWLGDDRLIYVTYAGSASTIHGVSVDRVSAKRVGDPIVIASYSDHIGLGNASFDGKRILFNRSQSAVTHDRAPIHGTDALTPRRDDHGDWELLGQSPDRKTAFYIAPSGSNRHEFLALDADGRSRVIGAVTGLVFSPQLTPDAASILFLHVANDEKALTMERLDMQAASAVVVETLPYAPSTPASFTDQLVAQLSCPRAASSRCVLGATEGQEQAFYEVDPAKGRGRRIGALPGVPPWSWAVSPDGEHISVANRQESIKTMDARRWTQRREIPNPDAIVHDVAWLDSQSFVLIGDQVGTSLIFRIDPGRAPVPLWTTATEFPTRPLSLDNGATLYFRTGWWTRTFWMLEAE
ncbi:MAG TPA: protein kinase [Kofleriaceae bacterium]|nr:protein kinase [Kofleriaceae bacterium]